MRFALFIAALAAVATLASAAKKSSDPKDCEVCKQVLGDIEKDLSKDDRKSLDVIEKKIADYCKSKDRSRTQKKVCYFLDPIKRMVSHSRSKMACLPTVFASD